MNRFKFELKCRKVVKKLKTRSDMGTLVSPSPRYNCICDSIRWIIFIEAKWFYVDNFKPSHYSSLDFWFGELSKENIPKRLKSFKEFKKLAIEKKAYREW